MELALFMRFGRRMGMPHYLLGSGALQHIQALRRAIDLYFGLLKQLYPHIIKKKAHIMLHLPHKLGELGLHLWTLPCERRHRILKRALQFAFGQHLERHTNKRVVATQLAGLLGQDSCCAFAPESRKFTVPAELERRLATDANITPPCWLARVCRTPLGKIAVRDVVCFDAPGGVGVGIVRACAGGVPSATMPDGFVFVLSRCRQQPNQIWYETDEVILCAAARARAVLPYVHSAGGMRVVMPLKL